MNPKYCIPDGDKSNIVYKINCHDCEASYVGEMGRALKTHVSEHRRAVEKRDFSASALAWEHDHHIDWTSMCVLETESHYHSRLCPGRQSTSVGSPLPLTRTEVPCLIVYGSYHSVVDLYHLKPYDAASHTTEGS